MVDTFEHGTIVIVVISSEALTTIHDHDLTCAEACIIGRQEENRLSYLLWIIQLAHQGHISCSLIQVAFIFFGTEVHGNEVFVVFAGPRVDGACGNAIDTDAVVGRLQSRALDKLMNHG